MRRRQGRFAAPGEMQAAGLDQPGHARRALGVARGEDQAQIGPLRKGRGEGLQHHLLFALMGGGGQDGAIARENPRQRRQFPAVGRRGQGGRLEIEHRADALGRQAEGGKAPAARLVKRSQEGDGLHGASGKARKSPP